MFEYRTETEHQVIEGVLFNDASRIRSVRGRGFDPDLVTFPSRTPLLHLALYKRADDEVVQALLDAGANPAALDARGRTAVHVAELMGRPDALRLLEAAGA